MPCRCSSEICGSDLKNICCQLLLASPSTWQVFARLWQIHTGLSSGSLSTWVVRWSLCLHYSHLWTCSSWPPPPPLTQWRLSGVGVERCQRWALIIGICRRVEAVTGGWWELGEEAYTLWKLLATWPQLVSTALPLSPQTRCILHGDGWVLLMLALLHSAHTNNQWCHNYHILKAC